MHRAVFFDRDNTLIVNDGDLGDPARVKLTRGAAAAVASLRGLGYRIVVVTNQGGVARGRYGEDDVEAVHQRIADLLLAQTNGAVIDGFYYCPFHPEGTVQRYRKEHPWRKPQPGMLLQAAEDLQLDLSMSWMIGDATRDVEAGHRAGVRTVMITEPRGEAEQLTLDPEARPDFTATTLVEAARIVAQQVHPDAAPSTGDEAAGATQPSPSRPPGATYPATQPLQTSRQHQSQAAETHRPFKPWSIQPRTPEDDRRGVTQPPYSEGPAPLAAEPNAAEGVAADVSDAASESASPSSSSSADAPAPRPAAREPRPTGTARPITPTPPAEPQAPAPPSAEPAPAEASRGEAEAAEAGEAASTEEPPDEDEAEAMSAGAIRRGDQVRLLRQILRELRYRRAHESDWSLAKIVGLGIAQPLAGFCGVLGIINFDQPGSLMAWLLGAIFVQLIVLTLMLVHWQR